MPLERQRIADAVDMLVVSGRLEMDAPTIHARKPARIIGRRYVFLIVNTVIT